MTTTIRLPDSGDWVSRIREKALSNMKKYESCAQSILAAFMEELGITDPLLLRSAGAMHGGLVCSYTCGVHMAGAMILGLLVGREDMKQGLDGLFPIVGPAQELMKRLNKRLGSQSCLELTGVDFTDLNAAFQFYAAGENVKCHSFVADGAEEIARFLKEKEASGELFRPAGR